MLVYWGYDGGWLNSLYKIRFGEDATATTLHRAMFHTVEAEGWTPAQLTGHLAAHSRDKELHGVVFMGHGNSQEVLTVAPPIMWGKSGEPKYVSRYQDWTLTYKLALVALYTCRSWGAASDLASPSPGAVQLGIYGELYPYQWRKYGVVEDLIIAVGGQGTALVP